ncbi:MAG TPA: TlpA disulfide reductase family protein [Albitalea sp.]|uniref:TlpA disulfide reductase family protein n=1 Tax=Piscinibacter sp. TaxID=1903157 RepID=UPI002ED3D30F
MNRRTWLAGGVGVAAAATGIAWSLRRGAEPVDAPPGLWDMSFDRPDGGRLALASMRGQAVLLNFWATWCAPCVKEMPMLDRFQRERQASGWRVVGLAVDGAEPVREFLARVPVSFSIGLAGLDGIELSRRLGNAGGGLPFSVVFDRQGRLLERHLGALQASHLDAWAARLESNR